MGTYKVQKGDTLSAIAKRYGTTAEEIAKANNIKDVNKISAGQTINIGNYNSSTSGTSTFKAGTDTSATKPTAPSFDYKPSDDVINAYNLLNEWINKKPGEYVSKWQTYIDETLQKILNREKFSYDLNGDMLYQQYKDQYTTQGKLAMMDTMGQAAAMTGGYGNSYAQTAGQQAYQGYLQQLNDKVPELYQLALNQYNQEGQELYNQYGLYVDRDSQDYNKYRDSMSDYYTDLQWLTDNARYMSETEYERAWNDFQAKYGYWRDTEEDRKWEAEFDFAKQQYEDSQKTKKTTTTSTPKKKADPVDPDPVAPNTTPTATANTKLFTASVMTQGEFAKRGKATVDGKTYTNYKSYIEACLEKWANNGIPNSNKTLTDDEIAFLMDLYGF